MTEENVAHEKAAAQHGDQYGDMGYGYVNRGNSHYSDMGPGYANRGNAPYINRGNAANYGYQNYGGPAPRVNYQPNYGNPAQEVYRGNYAPYARGYGGNYPYNAVNGYVHDYEHHHHHNHNDDHYNHYNHYYHYEHPFYGGSSAYNMPPGMRRNMMNPPYRGYGQYYNMPPGMGRHWMQHHDHDYPYFDGYGPGDQGPWGYVRNWFTYNPVTNWVRSPRGSNFLRGLGIATAGIMLAPAVVKTLRPLAVQAVHGVMSIVGEVKGVVSDAREELEDIFADAKWENLGDKEQKIQEGE